MTPHFADGYAVHVKRKRQSDNPQYAVLPLSYNGILIDWGNWINGIQWQDEDPLAD